MLHINPNNSTIKRAKIEYYEKVMDIILTRFDRLKSVPTKALKQIKSIDDVSDFIEKEVIAHLPLILLGNPSDLINISEYINIFLLKSEDLKIGLNYIFNYNYFIDKDTKPYNAYDLAESLNISTCPYCNRNYTNTVIHSKTRQKITRPQFDHYFDKGTNPLLSLSFYNLIPSCSICNSSIKGSTPMQLNTHLHPYIDNEIDSFQFSYSYDINVKSGLKIEIKKPLSPKIKDTLDVFAIEEIYNSHTDVLYDLLKIKRSFSTRYLDILENNLLKGVIVSRQEMYKIVFGTEYDSNYFINRPFSKFKKDILTELGVI